MVAMGGIAVLGELALPTHGALGLLGRVGVWLLIVPALWLTGFAHPRELAQIRAIAARTLARGAASEPA